MGGFLYVGGMLGRGWREAPLVAVKGGGGWYEGVSSPVSPEGGRRRSDVGGVEDAAGEEPR